eukprot:m.145286 g.145286  ORF g.145286 m.145286 type:complete len:64 (+) comp16216_c2_seq8:151-342(+)
MSHRNQTLSAVSLALSQGAMRTVATVPLTNSTLKCLWLEGTSKALATELGDSHGQTANTDLRL